MSNLPVKAQINIITAVVEWEKLPGNDSSKNARKVKTAQKKVNTGAIVFRLSLSSGEDVDSRACWHEVKDLGEDDFRDLSIAVCRRITRTEGGDKSDDEDDEL